MCSSDLGAAGAIGDVDGGHGAERGRRRTQMRWQGGRRLDHGRRRLLAGGDEQAERQGEAGEGANRLQGRRTPLGWEITA